MNDGEGSHQFIVFSFPYSIIIFFYIINAYISSIQWGVTSNQPPPGSNRFSLQTPCPSLPSQQPAVTSEDGNHLNYSKGS